jgi:Chaperone of endosialidase/Head domain of trimeric autotransporter adhesin
MPFLQTNQFSISFQFKKVIMKYLFISLILFAANKCAAQNVGIGTTTPIARLHVADSNVLFTGPTTVPSTTTYLPPAQGAGTRMMWYPQKAAFRVGNVDGTQWDFNDIGKYSFASGANTTASDDYSTAMGYFTQASGIISTAMGFGITAKSFFETAIGSNNTDYTPLSATSWNAGDRLFTIGNGENFNAQSDAMIVLKNGDVGIGSAVPSSYGHGGTNRVLEVRNYEPAAGNNIQSHLILSSTGSIGALGGVTWASTSLFGEQRTGFIGNTFETANRTRLTFYARNDAGDLGEKFYVSGNGTAWLAGNVGIGTTTPVARLHVADSSVLFTGPTTVPSTTTYLPPAQGAGTRMMWYPQKAAFRAGTVSGSQWDFNNVGRYSFASGLDNTASADYTTAMGVYTKASGLASTAIGVGSTAKSFGEIAIGANNTDYTPTSVSAWSSTDRLFVIGNGNGTLPSTSSNAMVILKNGNTGIGISNPTYKLHIGNSNSGLRIEGPALSGSGGSALNIGSAGDVVVDANGTVGGRFLIKETGNVGIGKNNPLYKLDVGGDINASGQVRANGIALSSDVRFKQNIITLPNALNNLLQLRGTNYFFNTNAFPERNFSSDKQMGVIAQEVEKIYPELVSTDKDGYKSVNYVGLIPVMIESIKELKKEIDELKQKIK